MVPTTDSVEEVSRFYDRLAGDYDRMTGFEKRFVVERPFFKSLVDAHGIRRAVDAGAGTGFHSLLLSELGVKVSAVDVSAAMLEALRRNAARRGVEIETVRSTFAGLAGRLHGPYDAVFCLGNSLPHILTQEELLAAVTVFRSLLGKGGILFVQLLNYAKLCATRDRLQGVREEGGKIFVRFYDFEELLVRFNILTLTRIPSGFETNLESVLLRPWVAEDMRPVLEKAGFSSTTFFGGISMAPFDSKSSKDLVFLSSP